MYCDDRSGIEGVRSDVSKLKLRRISQYEGRVPL